MYLYFQMEQALTYFGEFGIYFIGAVLIIFGYIGSITPSIPGPPIALISIYLLHYTIKEFSIYTLIILTTITVVMVIADYIVPILGTKKFGGTKYGVKGSTIGLFSGVLITIFTSGFGIIFLLLGPFVGAFLGEKYAGNNNTIAIKSAIGSFLGFIAGALGKIIVVSVILVAYLYHIFV